MKRNLLDWMTSGVPDELAIEPVQVTVSPGCNMRLLEAGTGTPVVLLHGLLGAAEVWRWNIPVLARTHRVLAIDQVLCEQHGWIPEQPAEMAATAERLLALLEKRGVERTHLIGHSYGGSLAMVFAARYPERVASLVLIAPPTLASRSLWPIVRFWSSPLGGWFAHRVPELPRRLQALALTRMYGNGELASEETLDLYLRALRRPGAIAHTLSIVRRWRQNMQAVNMAMPALRQQKVLLLWGDRDRTAPLELAEQLHAILPQAELEVIPGAGHLLFDEMPEETNLLLTDWLRRNAIGEVEETRSSEVA
ncbi:alpha/beta fold hydrolase [Terriglobus tenax]|uniref:alpha/beta fold hydrolase n=1 Tax=Terriglobus tenax TaxID=1111115 RepID=UPI0021E0497C|nr:alpha/beta hydrolase [Terriglobus tenax]